MITLDTLIAKIAGIGPRFAERLDQLGIVTVGELVRHFPSRYEDFSKTYRIDELAPGQQATIQGTVDDIEVRRSWRRGMTVIHATVSDETGSIRATWFNQPYLKTTLRPGTFGNFSGKVAVTDHELSLSHPTYELIRDPDTYVTKHTGRLVPIYPETRGLTSKGIRYIIQPILEHLTGVTEWIPEYILTKEHFPDTARALRDIHFPEHLDDALRAKARFAFEDLLLLQCANLLRQQELRAHRAPVIPTDIEDLKSVIAGLPFPLTLSQKKSLWEIIGDLVKPQPMNRLLQGDVGSGKTVVAALSAYLAARAGYQTAIMAPTEVLANQHYASLKQLFAHIKNPPTVGLLTGHAATVFYEHDLESSVSRSALISNLSEEKIKILIGTHALIAGAKGKKRGSAGALTFPNLGLVVIDEQHRFGVDQRAKLLRAQVPHGAGAKKAGRSVGRTVIPHFLSMSATPIPRTLMLTIFGDLDISIINELPKGRKVIETKVVDPAERADVYAFVKKEIKAGRQAFVICPRIDPEDEERKAAAEPAKSSGYYKNGVFQNAAYFKKLDIKSVTEEYARLSKKVFPDLTLGMLHGQMKAAEKEKVMAEFKKGAIDILVSTSVIEVGVDVPNASIMIIEGSERFGLAQLYQFRGRVGRGEHQSYCFLLTEATSSTVKDRLKAILTAKNGFELAEKDLGIRGPGEFIGEKQTGLPDSAMTALQNPALIQSTREYASAILREDPKLEANRELREKLRAFEKHIHME